jgi:hypothetical protein
MSVGVDETRDQYFSSTVNYFICRSGIDSADLIDSSVSYSEGRVCQDASLWVLSYDPVAILQNKPHDVHSWLRLACEIRVLEAL